MAHPGNHGSLGPLFHRDALGPGPCPAPDRRGVFGHGTGQALRKVCMEGMKRQEGHHCPEEVLNVPGLGLATAAGNGFFFLGVGVR